MGGGKRGKGNDEERGEEERRRVGAEVRAPSACPCPFAAGDAPDVPNHAIHARENGAQLPAGALGVQELVPRPALQEEKERGKKKYQKSRRARKKVEIFRAPVEQPAVRRMRL
jgi:hypothetical protein